MIHAYLICEPATAASLPSRRGVGGAQLRATIGDGLAAVYSRHRSLGASLSPELVLTHERVIEAVMANGAVLPLRFGTRLENEQQLLALMAARHDELLEALDRVRGHVEMGLRMLPRTGRGDRHTSASGRAYLLERVTEHQLAERAKRQIHLPLSELATAHVVPARVTPPAILAASYLVPAARTADFRTRAGQLAAGISEARTFVTGPLPPYSFAELPQTPGRRTRHDHRS